jgi:muramoyltetrapeptide carboxypeptidase LdcA involved in peptidoglycan recycling
MSLSGIFEKIKGMVIGHVHQSENNRPFMEVILDLTKKYNYPIIKTDYFGHFVNRFYTLPIGIIARINTEEKNFGLEEKVVF